MPSDDATALRDERIVGDDFHAEGAGAGGNFLSDSAEAAESERLATKFGARQLLLVPDATLHRGVGRRHRAGEREHQRERVLGDADAVAAGRIHDQDAARAGRVEIDVVDAGAGAGNHPKFRSGGEQLLVNFRRAAHDERVGVGESRRQDVCGAAGLRVDGPAGDGLQQFNCGGR